MNVREIKFRAFGNTNFSSEKMYSWEELLQKEYLLLNLIVECSEPHNAWKLMQFTGLHDKNGREIFEGDILLGNSVVTFLGGRFIAYFNDGKWEDIGSHSEVIGNVWENPELVQP